MCILQFCDNLIQWQALYMHALNPKALNAYM